MRRISYLAALTVLAITVLAPATMAESLASCGDFPFQAAAQAHLRNSPSESSSVDENNDGIACETYPYPPRSPREEEPVASRGQTQTTEQVATKETPQLPQSGGPKAGSTRLQSASLLSGLLLLGSGLTMFAVSRRSNNLSKG